MEIHLFQTSIKLYMGIIISTFLAVSTRSSFICVAHLVTGAQSLNAPLVSATTAATFISPVTRIHASE